MISADSTDVVFLLGSTFPLIPAFDVHNSLFSCLEGLKSGGGAFVSGALKSALDRCSLTFRTRIQRRTHKLYDIAEGNLRPLTFARDVGGGNWLRSTR